MNCHATSPIAIALPVLLLGAGCASIHHFDASSSKVCKGESVTLSWDATAKGEISATPPNSSPGSVFAQGTSVVTPNASGRYHLEVSTLVASDSRDVNVEVTEGKSALVTRAATDGSASCVGKVSTVTATAPAELAGATVAFVTSDQDDKHSYHIEHDGKSADLAPGGVAQAFKGSAVAGEWTLSLTLLPGEQCGTPSAPPKLSVQVVTSCDK
jgi:hypothetical protein